METLYYFAYGSNLNPDQMKERCPDAAPLHRGYLEEHALAFGGHSPHWEGSPATIIPEGDHVVPGLVYELPYRELRVLDQFEGHPVRYERREKTVRDENGARLETYVYVKDLDGNYGTPPEEYLEVLRQAYHDLGFDHDALDAALHLGAS